MKGFATLILGECGRYVINFHKRTVRSLRNTFVGEECEFDVKNTWYLIFGKKRSP